MDFTLLAPLALPLLLAGLSVPHRLASVTRFAPIAASIIVLTSGVLLIIATEHDQVPTAFGGVLRADSLSAYMLAVVGAVGLVSVWGGLRAVPTEHNRFPGGYDSLLCVFLAAMSLAVLADNIGVIWASVEATTIATAFLVGHQRTRKSLEAAWKYVILGSVGVVIALLGIVLIYAASLSAGEPTLSWLSLTHNTLPLDPALVRAGGALAVLGFATKAGLAPMHSWLPDAHSQAPAPVSGLMSGVLLSVALYAILRIQAIVDPIIGPDFLRIMLAVGALLSLAVAAALLIRQRDYKRMLAYSSIEHMGIMTLGAAVGSAAIPAVLLYILGHGLVKAVLFVLSGRILTAEGTSAIADVRGLLQRRPGLAVPWLVAMAAILGFPPFSIFFSIVAIILAGWAAGMGITVGIALFLVLVIFSALVRTTVTMTLGSPKLAPTDSGSADLGPADLNGTVHPDRSAHGPRLPLLLALATAAVIAFLTEPIGTILIHAAAALGRTH